MDTQNDSRIPSYGVLADLSRFHTVVGAKQLRKAVEKGSAKTVYLAQNADPAITQPLETMCLQNKIECVWVSDMVQLGHACGIDVGAAAAAVINK